ncbi:MAG: translation initiation factor IF-2 [Bacteroidales bacterium]|nr:translation initiation factor IF-2 [Bacteroidales bacterium]MDY4175352.1 translation initiation factor IF-2 [Bacteroidales bacterium]
MAGGIRINKFASESGVGVNTIIETLKKFGVTDELSQNSKIPDEMYERLAKEFKLDIQAKSESEKIVITTKGNKDKDSVSIGNEGIVTAETAKSEPIKGPKIVGKIDLSTPQRGGKGKNERPKAQKETAKAEESNETPAPEAAAPKTEPQTPAPQPEAQPEVKTEIQPEVNQEPQAPEVEPQPAQPAETPAPAEELSPKPEAEEPAPDDSPAPATNGESADGIFRLSDKPKLTGPTVLGKIELPVDKAPGRDSHNKKKRQRIQGGKEKVDVSSPSTISQVNSTLNKERNKQRQQQKQQQQAAQQQQNRKEKQRSKKGQAAPVKETSDEDVQKQVKETLARLTAKGHKTNTSKHNREKREAVRQRQEEEAERLEQEKKVLKVTEFVTASELATMMNVPVNKVIATFMSLGMFVSINQRLDAESLSLVAEEFGFKVEFLSVEKAHEVEEEEDDESLLVERPPIVTVMGHVDHGKTSLLDYIRNTNVIQGEAGGITQHIGAYSVTLENDRKITFLDTPGHEAFTAMRARGAQVTDVAIIIVAADDSVMPQTIEAINHASAAGVPIVFAINKIDKPGANPDKIREALANMNYLVEEWGGQYQCQEISAKKGINVDKLLEKVLLVADLQDLKANPDRAASGNVIESSLDKGRGYVATVLVRNGTLHPGDMVVCGSNYGRVKAMFNERNQKVDVAAPSTPVLVLGLNGAPQAGEKFNVFADEKEAKDVANKRDQLQREFSMRATPHITLDEIGRRIALGNFQELNVIVKGDVDGSVEALSDSLIRLSTEEIRVNVIHKAVGQISESDIMLATASNAVVIGFQVRPSADARRLAEKEKIDIRLYSIIYDAIEELKSAMEGMLSPEIREQVTGNLEIRETFKISKVGTIAGCFVNDGKVKSKSKVRIIRDGIVVHSGELESLKRFKDDVKEVVAGLECGLNVKGYNDIQVGDIIEAYEEIEVARKLS